MHGYTLAVAATAAPVALAGTRFMTLAGTLRVASAHFITATVHARDRITGTARSFFNSLWFSVIGLEARAQKLLVIDYQVNLWIVIAAFSRFDTQ